MRIAMVGTGYVGLVSGACFSEFGWHVTCVDKDAAKITRLQAGEIPIFEPGLDTLVAQNAEAGRLVFTTDLETTVRNADVVFIAVGTPSRRGDGHADLSYVYDAAREIAAALQGYTVIVTKSTVPVGTGAEVEAIMRAAAPQADFDVVSNPEFLREGSAIHDFMRPDRVVIGTISERAREMMRQLYRPLFLLDTPIIMTERPTSELIKYATNSFLATKITFINQLSDLCEKCGANVQEVAKGLGLDGRIGSKFLHVGPGYGGSCFPKDTLALVKTARDYGTPLTIVESVVAANDARKAAMAERILQALKPAQGATVGILGVTFKPNTDDMRESPSLAIIPALQAAGVTVQAYDPVGMHEAQKLLPNVVWCASALEAASGAEALVILTEWNEFRALDLSQIAQHMRRPVLFDLRNIYPAEGVEGFDYHSLGRPQH